MTPALFEYVRLCVWCLTACGSSVPITCIGFCPESYSRLRSSTCSATPSAEQASVLDLTSTQPVRCSGSGDTHNGSIDQHLAAIALGAEEALHVERVDRQELEAVPEHRRYVAVGPKDLLRVRISGKLR